MKKGKFITVEGPDGSGKSSCIGVIRQTLEAAGYKVITTREPGGTPLGEKIRAILLNDPMDALTELLMFAASRRQHLKQVILPYLEDGHIVISDRFSDSSYAYQGKARGYMKEVLELQDLVHQGFEPDYTLFFNVTLEESSRRLRERAGNAGELNRLDQEKEFFKAKVHQGYQEAFHRYKHRMHLINAMPPMDEVQASVVRWLEDIFMLENPV